MRRGPTEPLGIIELFGVRDRPNSFAIAEISSFNLFLIKCDIRLLENNMTYNKYDARDKKIFHSEGLKTHINSSFLVS